MGRLQTGVSGKVQPMFPGADKASPPLGLSDPEGVSGLQRGCCRVQHVLLWEVLPAGGGRQKGCRLALLSRCQPTPRYWAQGGMDPLLSCFSVRWNSMGTGMRGQESGLLFLPGSNQSAVWPSMHCPQPQGLPLFHPFFFSLPRSLPFLLTEGMQGHKYSVVFPGT